MDIRFRAWDGKKLHRDVAVRHGNAFVEIDPPTCTAVTVTTSDGLAVNAYSDWSKYVEQPTWILSQFTGLYDGRLQPVYDGDVVSWSETEGFGPEMVEYGGIYIVLWNRDWLRYDFYDPYASEWFPLNDTKFDAIVGNIWENPELLEVRDENGNVIGRLI